MCRFGSPAWYCRQSQIEKGESRLICQPIVRVQKTCAACRGSAPSRRIENATALAARKAPTKTSFARGRARASGYEAQRGASSRGANFVQPESATAAPRAAGEVTSQKPQIRKSGGSASFVFELETYCVKGYATQAKASVTASLVPPNRRPTRARPSTHSRSNRIELRCAAGRSSHLPVQPRIRQPGRYDS